MNIEDRTEFWDLIGKIAGDLDKLDWAIIDGIGAGEPITDLAITLNVGRRTIYDRLERMQLLARKQEQCDKLKWG